MEVFIDCMAKLVFSPEMKPRLLESEVSFGALSAFYHVKL